MRSTSPTGNLLDSSLEGIRASSRGPDRPPDDPQHRPHGAGAGEEEGQEAGLRQVFRADRFRSLLELGLGTSVEERGQVTATRPAVSVLPTATMCPAGAVWLPCT